MPFFEIGGVRLHYTVAGDGSPIVFLAGMTLDSAVWHGVAEQMKRKYQAIGVDVRGSGHSDAPRGVYSIDIMANEVGHLVSEKAAGSAVVVGHSMGGFVAMMLALAQPERVKGLVLMATSPIGVPIDPGVAAVINQTAGPYEEIVRSVANTGMGPRIQREQPQAIERFIQARCNVPPRGVGATGQRAAIQGFDIRDRLNRISCPCRVIHGTSDAIIPIERGRALASALPRADFYPLAEVGHFPQVEAPSVLSRLIAGFMDGLTSRPRSGVG